MNLVRKPLENVGGKQEIEIVEDLKFFFISSKYVWYEITLFGNFPPFEPINKLYHYSANFVLLTGACAHKEQKGHVYDYKMILFFGSKRKKNFLGLFFNSLVHFLLLF